MKKNSGTWIVYMFFICAIVFQLSSLDAKESSNVVIKKHEKVEKIKDISKKLPKKKRHPYKMSASGKKFIKKHESCKLEAYNDPTPQKKSIGWGHQIKKDEKYVKISQNKADQLFNSDIELINASINRMMSKLDERFVFNQNFIDGLGDLIYNCGENGAQSNEFWRRMMRCRYDKSTGNINKRDFEYALSAIKTSHIYSKGHIERRKNEYNLMREV